MRFENGISSYVSILTALVFLVSAQKVAGGSPEAKGEEAGNAYSYQGDELRDPFIPLVGQELARTVKTQKDEKKGFQPELLEIKGIIAGKATRLAVLKSPAGITYYVKNGRIKNAKKETVEGFVGIVKEKSLVLIGPNNEVVELVMKKGKEEKTSAF